MLAMALAAGGTAGATAAPKAARSLVYFIFTGYTPPYFAPMATGITAAAKKYPSLNIKTLAANGSDSTEVSDIKEAVAAGAKGIILNPIDNSVTSAAEQAMKSGVPVVTIDRDVASTSGRIAYIGDKDVTLGQEQTSYGLSWLAKQGFKKPWRVVILQGTLGSSTAIDRLAGAMDALKSDIANKSVKVVLSQSANFDTGTAQTLMTEELAKTTNIQLVIAGNDAMALGAITAFKTHGITLGKTVGIVGADAQPESLTDIKAGTQLDSVTHSPYVEAFWAVETLSKYLTSHKKPANPDIVIPMTVVTKANVSKVTGWGTPKTVPALP
jgi:ABC-type sugar transport system substrate-binding protein